MEEKKVSPFFVAEISANHKQSLPTARRLVELAAKSGADAVKFQTFLPQHMTPKRVAYSVSSEHSLWGGRNLHELYMEAQTPWEWHKELFDLANSLNLTAFSSPFCEKSVEFLEQLNCPLYKVASLETGDRNLLRAIASTSKPVIASTGASTLEEIDSMVHLLQSLNVEDLTLLLCTSAYPASPSEIHLSRMQFLKDRYSVPVGLSDHTKGIGVSIFAAAHGATVIERHFIEFRSDNSLDSEFSLEPNEFALMAKSCREGLESIGEPKWRIQDSEKSSRELRRSLYVVTDVKQGDRITVDNVRALRPNLGLAAEKIDLLIGKTFSRNVNANSPLRPEDVND